MHPTIIKSAYDGITLEFFDLEADYFKVRLSGSDFSGTARVYVYEPMPTHLANFFRDLANQWQGWPGKKEWVSLEGELSLTATSDSTGHTSLSVRLRSGPYPFDWSLSGVLLIEAGQLEGIAARIEKFQN